MDVALINLDQVDIKSVLRATMRQVPKNKLKPWQKERWVIPPGENVELVYYMEDILGLYYEPYDPHHPKFCFDESSGNADTSVGV